MWGSGGAAKWSWSKSSLGTSRAVRASSRARISRVSIAEIFINLSVVIKKWVQAKPCTALIAGKIEVYTALGKCLRAAVFDRFLVRDHCLIYRWLASVCLLGAVRFACFGEKVLFFNGL